MDIAIGVLFILIAVVYLFENFLLISKRSREDLFAAGILILVIVVGSIVLSVGFYKKRSENKVSASTAQVEIFPSMDGKVR